LIDSPDNAQIRILTTFYDTGRLSVSLFDLLVGSNRTMQILLMDPSPNNVVLEKRYGREELRQNFTPKMAASRIDLELKALEDCRQRLAEHGKSDSLRVRVYDTIPTLTSLQVGDRMLVGFLFTRKSGEDSPMVILDKADPAWNVFAKNWEDVWGLAKPTDQSGQP
jgi:hypothetical protein